MPSRKTEQDYHDLAQATDNIIEWLGPAVSSANKYTYWRCECGGEIRSTYSRLKSIGTSGCKDCVAEARLSHRKDIKTEQDYHNLAKNKNLKWTGKILPRGVKSKTMWLCQQCYNDFLCSYDGIKAKSNNATCEPCSYVVRGKNRRFNDNQYEELSNEKDHVDRWLGPSVNSSAETTSWLCINGHKFESSYDNLKHKTNCPICYGGRKLPQHYHELAKEKNIEWLGPLPETSKDKTRWLCSCGNIRETSYFSIKRNKGNGCVKCMSIKIKEDQYIDLANKRSDIDKWLGPFTGSVNKDTYWRCIMGHEWMASYNRVGHAGCGCPVCKNSTGERAIKDFLDENSVENIPQKRFPTCIYKKTMPFDFYLPDYNILIEYNGEQHYEYQPGYYHKDGYYKFEEQQERDAIKAQWAAENGYTLIVIPYTEKDNIEQILSRYL